jgi:hypothetical protein
MLNEAELTKQRKATRFTSPTASLPFQRLHQSTSKCWTNCNLLIQLKTLQKSNEIGANAVQRRQKFDKVPLKKLPSAENQIKSTRKAPKSCKPYFESFKNSNNL